MKIKVKEIIEGCMPKIIDKGEWIDLRAAEDISFMAPQASSRKRKTVDGVQVSYRDISFDTKLIKLGIAIELPKGFEAQVLPRSSTPKLNIFQTNSEGVIDNVYNGNTDEWRFWATALAETSINKGDRICQFRIQLSQKATIWQKLRWLFSRKIELVKVNNLSNSGRGGFGTTGVK